MAEIWYRVDWGREIRAVEVHRETPKTVVVNKTYGKGTATQQKITTLHRYFKTRDEAVTYIRDKLVRNIDFLERQLEASKAELRELK